MVWRAAAEQLRRAAIGVVAVLAIGFVVATATTSSAAVEPGCPDVLFLGARGSGEAPVPPHTAADDAQLGLGSTLWNAFKQVQLDTRGLRVDGAGIDYLAAPVFPDHNQPSLVASPGYYAESVKLGAQEFVRVLRDRIAACGSVTDFVVAGYSQGAWVLHEVLVQLTAAERREIGAVLMFGDPLLNPTSDAVKLKRPRGGFGSAFALTPPQTLVTYVPRDVVERTVSYCLARDPICQPATAGPLTLINCGQGLCPHFDYVADGVSDRGGSFAARLVRPLAQQVAITTTSLPEATAGTPYTVTFTAGRGRVPYRWSILSGRPAWLRLASATGVLTGTPPAAGQATLRVQVADARGSVGTATLVLRVRAATLSGTWAQDGFDSGGTGVNPAETGLTTANVSGLRTAWSYPEPAGSMLSRPVVAGTTGFVVSHTLNAVASRLVAVDLSTGSRRWQRTLDGSAYLSPVTADGRVFVQTSNGVFAYATATGAPDWSIAAPTATTCRAATMVVDGSTLYAFSDRTVSAVDTASGAVRWTTEADVYCFTGIAVSNGRLFAVSRSVPTESSQTGQLRALDAQTGAVLWTRTTAATIDGRPVATRDVVYAGTQYAEPGLLALDAASGAVRWQRADLIGMSAPAVTADRLVYSGDTVSGTTTVHALNPLTGATVWTRSIAGAVTESDPAVADDVVYVGSRGDPKAVHALRLDNGGPLTALQLGTSAGNNEISPVVVAGTVLASVTPDSGFGTPTTALLRAFRLP